MKKMLILSLGVLLMMSSCGTYQATGAYTGAHFGSIIGSAVGGITGGWRGSDVGSLIGLAGGAVVGAAIGKAADDKAEARATERYERHRRANAERYDRSNAGYDNSGFDPQGRGDDRIMLDGGMAPGHLASAPARLEMSDVHIIDVSHDGRLQRGESGHVVFEIHNPTDKPAYSVQPTVMEITGNRHIHISENILIESIQPKQTIRYTAQVKADKGLRNGEAIIRVAVLQGGREMPSLTRDFRLVTVKR